MGSTFIQLKVRHINTFWAIISLDIISGQVPSGQSLGISGLNAVKTTVGSVLTIYVTVDDQSYRLRGDKEYEDLMIVIASGITSIEEDEEMLEWFAWPRKVSTL